MSTHAPDEFDRAARERTIVGAHRRARPGGRRVLPVLLVLVLAPLAAWALFTFVIQAGVLPSPSELIGGTASVSASPSATGSAAGQATPSPTPTRPADVRLDTALTLLDGTEAGAAGQDAADALEAAGYTQLRIGEYGATEPALTTVYYRDATVEDTARDVAARLERATGADAVDVLESATAASSAPIVAVLRD